MRPLRTAGASACLLGALLLASCASRRPPVTQAQPGESVGLYKARLMQADGKQRRFRLWLFAEMPDRFHGEVISPVGTTEIIIDGGDGRLAICLPRDRVAFVGPADSSTIEKLLGVRVEMDELVRILLTGEVGDTEHDVTRSDTPGVGLPDRLEIHSERQQLSLLLKRREALGARGESLGRGIPPSGMDERSLEELDLADLPVAREE